MSDTPANYEDDNRCTTTRQNPHSTTVVVRYPWHPWFEWKVDVERAVTKYSQAVLHVICSENRSSRLREIPAWMADAAVCNAMCNADQPVASIEALRALQFVTKSLYPESAAGVIENQHSCSPSSRSQGDADVRKTGSRRSGSTRSVSAVAKEASLGEAAARSPAESVATAHTTDQRADNAECGVSRRKGGRS